MQQLRVAAVVVSHNQCDLLQATLRGLRAQTVRPNQVIVVDNASTDGAARIAADNLALWGSAGCMISLDANIGAAGAHTVGIAAAVTANIDGYAPDWVWVLSEGCVPHSQALEAALTAHRKYVATGSDTLAVISSQLHTDTPQVTLSHRPAGVAQQRASAADAIPIRTASFASVFVRTSRLHAVGLPSPGSHSALYAARLLRRAHGILVPHSVVTYNSELERAFRDAVTPWGGLSGANMPWAGSSSANPPWVGSSGADTARSGLGFAAVRKRARALARSLTVHRQQPHTQTVCQPQALAEAGVPQAVIAAIDALSTPS